MVKLTRAVPPRTFKEMEDRCSGIDELRQMVQSGDVPPGLLLLGRFWRGNLMSDPEERRRGPPAGSSAWVVSQEGNGHD